MLVIRDATISTGCGNETRRVNIYIEGERISAIGDAGSKIPDGAEAVAADGLLVLPGAIDPHVHFDTPGYEWREDFRHGTLSAVAGGVTTIIDMPDTSIPEVTDTTNLEKKLTAIEGSAHADFALWGGVSGNVVNNKWWMDDMRWLWEAGVAGFKTYLISGMDTFRELSIIELGQVMAHSARIGALVGLHAEDRDIIRTREEALKKDGKDSLFDYYFSCSDPAEESGAVIGVQLARQTGARLHIVHAASAGTVEAVARGKALGVDVTAETCPQYLHFTYRDFKRYGSLIKTAPVVKTAADRKRLWSALSDGTVDFAATDHAPCPLREKETGSAWTDYGGLPGVELMLPYLFSFGYVEKRLTLARLIEVTSTSAAKRFGLYPRKGAIAVDCDADLAVIDPGERWRVEGANLHSRSKWTPLEGVVFTGRVVKTILRGRVVFDCADAAPRPPTGKWQRRGSQV